MNRLLAVEARFEQDLVSARQRARQVADLLDFEVQDQARIVTAVSELVRNALQYAGHGRVEFAIVDESHKATTQQSLHITVRDRGPGIANLQHVLDGRAALSTPAMGLVGVRRLMDSFEITSSSEGTSVVVSKRLPPKARPAVGPRLAAIVGELTRSTAGNPYEELQRQNQELMRVMEELQSRQEELEELNRELEDTNRGVVALYAELDASAESLRRASELKSKFLSNMSHEFRTPLNSIRSLSKILLDRLDGELAPEQEKQVQLIRRSAESLTELVNDLLDMAKVEAGKLTVRPEAFEVGELLSTLRGMLRPLMSHGTVELLFDDPGSLQPLFTDEGKVSQILRNLISNALKFTTHGEIRVSARLLTSERILFAVADTGIGIAAEDQERIFQEYSQVDGPLQRNVKGTGLGLPLSKKLAELLGGQVSVSSRPGIGSTFSLEIPVVYGEGESSLPTSLLGSEPPHRSTPPARSQQLLLIDDDEVARYLLRVALTGHAVEILEAECGSEGLQLAVEHRPDVIVLDLVMPDLTGFEVFERLKADSRTQGIPVIIRSSKILDESERRRLDAALAVLTKEEESRPQAVLQLGEALRQAGLNMPLAMEGCS